MKLTLFIFFTILLILGCGRGPDDEPDITGTHKFNGWLGSAPLYLTLNEDGTYKYRSKNSSWALNSSYFRFAETGTWELEAQPPGDGWPDGGEYLVKLSGQEFVYRCTYHDHRDGIKYYSGGILANQAWEKSFYARSLLVEDSLYSDELKNESLERSRKAEVEDEADVAKKLAEEKAAEEVRLQELERRKKAVAAKKLAEEKAAEEEKRLQMPFDIANAWTKKLRTKGVDDQNVQIRPLRDGVKIVLRQGEKNTLFESSSFELSNFGKSVLQKVCSLIPQGVLEFSVDSHTHKFDASLVGGGNLDSFKLSYAQGKETVKMLDHYLSGKLTKKLQNINSYGSENIEYQRTPSSRKNRRLELSLVLQSHPDPKAGVQKTTSIDIDVLHRIAQDWYERLRLHEIDDSTIQIEATSGGIKITLFHSDTKPLFESSSSELTAYGREVMNKMSWLLSQNVLEFSVDSRAHRFDRIMEEMIDPIEFTYSIVEALNHFSSGELENKLTTIKAYGKSLSKIQEGHNGGRKKSPH